MIDYERELALANARTMVKSSELLEAQQELMKARMDVARMSVVIKELATMAPDHDGWHCDYCGWIKDDHEHEGCAALDAQRIVEDMGIV